MRSVLLAALVVLSALPRNAAADLAPVVAQFTDHCAPCHSVGGGDAAGPDLLPATKKPPEELRVAIKSMEANVGPLTAADIDGYIALLRSPDVQTLVSGGVPHTPAPPAVPQGSPDAGRHLFFGGNRFANGGTPCFACHAVGGRGGNLAADLTRVHSRIGDRGILAVAQTPAFPMMKAAYGKHPVTAAEAVDLAAFLRTFPVSEATGSDSGVLHNAAAGAVVAILGAVALLFRARREGVRARMVRRAGAKS